MSKRRVVGHVVEYDNMGLGRINHPMSCAEEKQCAVWRALVDQKVLSFDGHGTYHAVLSRSEPGYVRLAPVHHHSKTLAMAKEITEVLDQFAEEVGRSIASKAVFDWVDARNKDARRHPRELHRVDL